MMSFDALHNIVLTQFSSFSKTIILSALNKLAHGTLTVHIDESDDLDSKAETFVFGSGKPEAEITVRSKNVWTRLAMNLDLGTAEAYMLRELEINDIVSLLLLFLANIASLGQGSWLLQFLPKLQRYLLKPTNNERQALENAGHYDTSNFLFSCFLSPDMSYSSAIWKTGSDEDESLGDAQLRKVHNIIDKARVRKHHHILDIGGGWCFLAIEAVKKTGCKVTVTTLSVEQKGLGDKRVQDAGLEGSIEIFLCDYRKTPVPEGGYDRIVSVEMLEHVGREYMDTYFATISSMLNPTDGIMVVQGITAINKLHENPDKMDTFLERYIFPNGYLPSIHRLVDSIHVGSNGSLEIDSVQSIGPHYVKTLRTWRENFIKNWAAIRQDFEAEKKEKSDGKFTEAEVEAWKRRWVYYFSFCEAAFRGGVLGDHIVVARRRPSPEEADGVPF